MLNDWNAGSAVLLTLLLVASSLVRHVQATTVLSGLSIIDHVTGEMVITFSEDTNQGGDPFGGPRPCSELIQPITPIAEFDKHICRFASPRKLFIDAPYTSDWKHTTAFNLTNPSPIRRLSNNRALDWFGPLTLQMDSRRPVSAPKILGASLMPACGQGLRYQIDAQFSGGRRWKTAFISVSIGTFRAGSPLIDLDTLTFGVNRNQFSAIPSALGEVIEFTVTLTNAFSASATSTRFRVEIPPQAAGPVVPVVVRGGAATRVFKASQSLRLSAGAQIEPTCIGILNIFPSVDPLWVPEFLWQVSEVDSENAPFGLPLPGLVSDKPEFVIPPHFVRPKFNTEKRFFVARVELRAPRLRTGKLGEAFVPITVLHSDPVVVLETPSWTENNTVLMIDASRSCDPDFVRSCLPTFGNTNASEPGLLNFTLIVERDMVGRFEHVPFNISRGHIGEAGGESGEGSPPNRWSIAQPVLGNYRITLVVTRLSFPSEPFYVRKLVFVRARPSPSNPARNCTVPPKIGLPTFLTKDINLLDFPIQVPDRVAPFVIRAAAVSERDSLTWTLELKQDEIPLPLSFSPFANRPSLSIAASALFPGYSYSFRLTALSSCGAEEGLTFGSVSFKVNVPPSGGTVIVRPSSGIGFTTKFALETGGWAVSDPDAQLPLSFEFQYLRQGSRASVTLGSGSLAPSLVTRLSSPRLNCRANSSSTEAELLRFARQSSVVVLCRDALGSVSTASSSEFTVNPLFTPKVTVIASLPLPNRVVDDVKKEGGSSEDILRGLQILSDEAASTECLGQSLNSLEQDALALWRQGVVRQTLTLIRDTRASFFQQERAPSITELNFQISVLSSAFGGSYSKFGQSDFVTAVDVVTQLLNDVGQASRDLGSSAPISFDFGTVFLDVFSGLSKFVQFYRQELEGRDPLQIRPPPPRTTLSSHVSRRGLQTSPGCDWQCNVQSALNRGLRRLINILLSNFEPGTPPQIIRGADVELKLSREFRDNVGSSGGVNKLDLGGNGPQFHLPPNVLRDRSRIRNGTVPGFVVPDTIDICAIRFRYNPLELFQSAKVAVNDLYRVSPNFSISEVNTLLFLNNENPDQNYDPFNLTTRINITIPLPTDHQLPGANSSEVLACGFWDESFNGWSTEGCSVVEVNAQGRYLICSCNHASDFAAWNAFLANLGGGDLGEVATIAIVVLCILFPGLLALWLFAFLWARNRDYDDSHAVHLGALLVLTKNRLRLHQQQRRFFQLLRENARREPGQRFIGKAQLPREDSDDGATTEDKLSPQGRRFGGIPCCNRRTMIGGWLRAIKYEHSLFGVLTRFDPFYTRTQRITVLAAVVVGNLFASSFFFEFKTAEGLSAGVLLASVIIASLVVAIPVKMIVRWLFRATEQQLGSPMHRCAQIYRISELQAGDLLPAYASEAERADVQMLFAFKDYYQVKSQMKALQLLKREMELQEGKSTNRYIQCQLGCRTVCNRVGHRPSAETVTQSLITRLGLKVDEKGQVNAIELDKALESTKLKSREVLESLRAACVRSSTEWSKVPQQPNLRVETMRRQQSTILKLTSLMYDESEDRVRTRRKQCRSAFIYVAWFIVFVYLVGGLAYCARWVLARTSYRGTLSPGSTEAELAADANGIIVAWLLSSAVGIAIGLFISEPVIQFIRFGIAPAILRTFGSGTVPMFSKSRKIKVNPNALLATEDGLDKPVVAHKVDDEPIKTTQSESVARATTGTTPSAKTAPPAMSLMDEYKQKKKKRAKRKERSSDTLIETLGDIIETLT